MFCSAHCDRSWRNSTHHYVLNGGEIYLDLVKKPDSVNETTISCMSMGGFGSLGEFEKTLFPPDLFETSFAGLDEGGSREFSSDDQEFQRIRDFFNSCIKSMRIKDKKLLAKFREEKLLV